MRPHEKLTVWKSSIDFSTSIYAITESFPKREWYGLSQQIRRASVSIASNIAEGSALGSARAFRHYLSTSQGSSSEVATQLLIAMRLGYIERETYVAMYKKSDEIGRMISGLRRSIEKK